VNGDTEPAEEFEQLFRAVYLTFHRRDAPRSQLPNASLAVLEHLALAGPLTIGEAAAHLRRAQSVVSEIVSHLELQARRHPGTPREEIERQTLDYMATMPSLARSPARHLANELTPGHDSDQPGNEVPMVSPSCQRRRGSS
jgi:hypothetical protein